MSNYFDALPITQMKLRAALRDHKLDRELDEYSIRLRLLAIEMELERQEQMLHNQQSGFSIAREEKT